MLYSLEGVFSIANKTKECVLTHIQIVICLLISKWLILISYFFLVLVTIGPTFYFKDSPANTHQPGLFFYFPTVSFTNGPFLGKTVCQFLLDLPN